MLYFYDIHKYLLYFFQGNGQRLNLECLDKLGLSDCKDKIRDMVRKMKELKIDINEYLCLKYLILLNPGESICLKYLILLNLGESICLKFYSIQVSQYV